MAVRGGCDAQHGMARAADQILPAMKLPGKTSRRGLLIILFALCMPPGIAHGMEFSVGSFMVDPVDGRHVHWLHLLMKGEIVPGDYGRLLDFAVRNNIDLTHVPVVLSSPGGDVTEALKLGQLIKSLYLKVSVFSWSGPCASACFIMYASALERTAEPGIVGLHRPYVSPERVRSLSPADTEALETRALSDAETYLHKLRVPNSLVDAMFEQASTEIHWLTGEELENQLGRRAPWYEELLIARCGLDKDAERKYLFDPNDNLTAPAPQRLVDVVRCESKLTRPDAVNNFAKALAPYTYGFSDEKGIYRLPAPPASPEGMAKAMAIVWQHLTVERHGRRYTTNWGILGHQVIVYYGADYGKLDIGQGGASPEALATKIFNEIIDQQEADERSMNELSARCAANPKSCEVSP